MSILHTSLNDITMEIPVPTFYYDAHWNGNHSLSNKAYMEPNYVPGMYEHYSEYSLIRRNSFPKNMAD